MNDRLALRVVLCPVDFFEPSRHALRWAAALALRCGGRLTVLSVVDPLLAEAARVRLGLELVQAETEPAIREFVAATWSSDAPPLSDLDVNVEVGKPGDVIRDAAARTNADLIVMGTQGLGGIRKWVLGSTTERVLRRTQVAVLAVPPPATDSVVTEAVSRILEKGTILAATDFSDTAQRALRWAAHLAYEGGNSLLIIHVIEPLVVPSRWQAYIERPSAARVAGVRARLEELATRLAPSAKSECVVEVGSPAEAIASAAGGRAAMIVMGLAGDQGPFGIRPGSIAYRVLSLARIPVLVVPVVDVTDDTR